MGLTAGSAHKIRALLSRLCIFCSGSDLSSCSTACSSFCRRSVRARSSPPTPATTSTSALWASPSPRCVSARLEEHAIAMLLLSVPGPTCVPSGRNSTRMRFSRSSRGIHSGGNALVLPALFFQEDCPGDSWLVDVRLWLVDVRLSLARCRTVRAAGPHAGTSSVLTSASPPAPAARVPAADRRFGLHLAEYLQEHEAYGLLC